MRNAKLWERLLGVERTVVDGVVFDEEDEVIIASVRPRKGAKRRCGICAKRCPGYDQGEGPRRWRSLDLGTIRTYLEADPPRVSCAEHGVVVAQVPWARHDAGHTRKFDDMVAWLAPRTQSRTGGAGRTPPEAEGTRCDQGNFARDETSPNPQVDHASGVGQRPQN